jgi:hypothetical protein
LGNFINASGGLVLLFSYREKALTTAKKFQLPAAGQGSSFLRTWVMKAGTPTRHFHVYRSLKDTEHSIDDCLAKSQRTPFCVSVNF